MIVSQKLIDRDERAVVRALHYVHEHDGNYTFERVQIYCYVLHVHDRTARRVLNMVTVIFRLGRNYS